MEIASRTSFGWVFRLWLSARFLRCPSRNFHSISQFSIKISIENHTARQGSCHTTLTTQVPNALRARLVRRGARSQRSLFRLRFRFRIEISIENCGNAMYFALGCSVFDCIFRLRFRSTIEVDFYQKPQTLNATLTLEGLRFLVEGNSGRFAV